MAGKSLDFFKDTSKAKDGEQKEGGTKLGGRDQQESAEA